MQVGAAQGRAGRTEVRTPPLSRPGENTERSRRKGLKNQLQKCRPGENTGRSRRRGLKNQRQKCREDQLQEEQEGLQLRHYLHLDQEE